MTGPGLVVTPLPVGGAALLALYGADKGDFAPPADVTTMTLSRSANGSAFAEIYSGLPLPFWVDVGDGPSTSSQPLDATTLYEWQATDSGGTTTVGPATLGGAIVTVPDGLTTLLIRLLQAAVDNAPRPSGVSVSPAQVTTQMPAGGWGAMPFIVVNQTLTQQRFVAVGQDVTLPGQDNLWTLPGWNRRVWQVSVLSQNADERDFYRDTLMIAWRALVATLFSQVAQDIEHNIQANSGTTGDEWQGQGPTLYWADVMMTIAGSFDVTIATGYGLIARIDVAVVTDGGNVVDEIQIPPTF